MKWSQKEVISPLNDNESSVPAAYSTKQETHSETIQWSRKEAISTLNDNAVLPAAYKMKNPPLVSPGRSPGSRKVRRVTHMNEVSHVPPWT